MRRRRMWRTGGCCLSALQRYTSRMRRLRDAERESTVICLVSVRLGRPVPTSLCLGADDVYARLALWFRAEEGAQGRRECSGDVRGSRREAGKSLGAEHVRAGFKALARVRLGRGASLRSFFLLFS